MKLAALGGATVVMGLVLGENGLVAVGVLWALLGPVARQLGRTVKSLKTADGTPELDGRTFAGVSALWLVLGVPSLLVGLLELGISPEHATWRWLPLVVGAVALTVGIVSAVLYATGSAVRAKVGPEPTVPATIWIRSVTETGTFINERPRMEFGLLVEPGAGSTLAAYEVTKKATVPYTALGSLQVGAGFVALVDGPENPTAIDIHWDEPVAPRDDAETPDEVPTRLAELELLHSSGQVSDEEYRVQRERILSSL